MNIQFHYYIVRYLSSVLGFDDKNSRLIAQTSQFIDDSKEQIPVEFPESDVSEKIRERGLDFNAGNNVVVYIPKTIHSSFDDFADFKIDNKDNICWTGLVPFHYTPDSPLKSQSGTEKESCLGYKIHSIKNYNFNEHEIFKPLIDDAVNMYKSAKTEYDKIEAAVRIGAIAHMLADNYAHPYLNGFVSWINDTEALQVINGDVAGTDLTANYILNDAEKSKISKVGCYRMKTAMDDSFVKVTFSQPKVKNGPSVETHQTDNLKSFMDAAKCLYYFFRKITGKPDGEEAVWEGTYKPILRKMLSFRETDINKLNEAWEKECPDIEFSYSADDIKTKLGKSAYSDYLFSAAIVADDMRKSVISKEDEKNV
ncbi:MAG: DUF6765 family protein [Deltaproteobacteria bacterium]